MESLHALRGILLWETVVVNGQVYNIDIETATRPSHERTSQTTEHWSMNSTVFKTWKLVSRTWTLQLRFLNKRFNWKRTKKGIDHREGKRHSRVKAVKKKRTRFCTEKFYSLFWRETFFAEFLRGSLFSPKMQDDHHWKDTWKVDRMNHQRTPWFLLFFIRTRSHQSSMNGV